MRIRSGLRRQIPAPPEADEPIDLSPLAGVGAGRRGVRRASLVIRWLTLVAVAVALLVAWHLAAAETLTGRVVGITDGDTLTVLVDRRQVKVRLDEIDAPERRQAFGMRARQALSDLCFDKTAVLETHGKSYKRVVAHVRCAGVDVDAEMVRTGMAWVYVHYAAHDSPLYALEAAAREAHVGLWADAHPTPPWKWRWAKRRRR